MKTLLIDYTERVNLQKEVSLPYYTKSSEVDVHWYKIYGTGDRDCIQVTISGKTIVYVATGYTTHAIDSRTKECSEDEFMKAFKTAMDTLYSQSIK